jgi:hypothetical protein
LKSYISNTPEYYTDRELSDLDYIDPVAEHKRKLLAQQECQRKLDWLLDNFDKIQHLLIKLDKERKYVS